MSANVQRPGMTARTAQRVSTSGLEWICAAGPYQDHIRQMAALKPGLDRPDSKNNALVSRIGTSRCVELEIQPDLSTTAHLFQDETELRMHFAARKQSHAQLRRRIYLLEGLDPNYVDALGSYFWMDPSVFVQHERNAAWNAQSSRADDRDVTPLPSLRNAETYWRLRYREVRQFGIDAPDWRTTCAVTGSHLAGIGFDWRLDGLVALERKCSYWFQENGHDSWDGKLASAESSCVLKSGSGHIVRSTGDIDQ